MNIKLMYRNLLSKLGYNVLRLMLRLFKLLPNSSRRTMFLTSMYFYLSNQGIFKEMSLKRFSSTTGIKMSDASMELPLASKDMIWANTQIVDILRRELGCTQVNSDKECHDWATVKDVCEKIVDQTPPWLRYAKKQMVMDTMKLFYH